MSHQIKIPPVGESVVSALVARWHIADGASVEKGQVLVTLETDKISNELEAEVAGKISITIPEGEEVEIGTVIGLIDQAAVREVVPASELAPSPPEKSAAETLGSEGEKVNITVPSAGESITSATVAVWAVSNNDYVEKGQSLVSLDTDKVSSELEAEVSGIITIEVAEGTEVSIGEKLGSIEISTAPISSPLQAPSPGLTSVESPVTQNSLPTTLNPNSDVGSDESRVTRRKITPLRRKIAQHLVNAQQTAAILTTFNEVDMTEVMKLRKSLQEEFVAKHGVKLGFMSLFTKAVVQALKDIPAINARIEDDQIIENHFYDIGIAIGTEKGLIVPVVRDCDQKSFAEIEKDIIEYSFRSKEGKIELSDLSGGVFTISNGGVYGSLLSTPILNPPQSGILGMHTIQQRPMAVNGKVEIRPMMYLAMSYDHRLVDGKEAVSFLIRIKDCLENPTRMMLEM
ncbi:dihydrolipoyllysine-residue succinyltransferase [Akkermansiaceae bacterium]|nr:dihydrolipoyllysine-residue succinyltransferase [Akkermansiaceae bacterium]MDA9196755.1 dihydrolipoyllysine-residue succinyltransferase [Akkermansiaceae bacterium]MDB4398530.1 dihydrolipoyllysine-residue succinyltransferase [Akkermansiaceae bacterium]MDB4479206.1 dihydrolipoyllysine-residue succinyltransferase [Akkermansiaceae bacterium]MDB4487221.1 dihydrolipoyllysine-residue succinyltransferase [Akkermansiaceae bacterium]